jgi:NAD(P)-dependent dehydrogenase (short-subunit alcohol dehydrogenase family)
MAKKRKKLKNPLSILVVGASGMGYGGEIANTLESSGHNVYSMQRKPRFSGDDAYVDPNTWCSANLTRPADTVATVRDIHEQEVVLDAVVHAAVCCEEVELVNQTSFTFQEAFQVNVIEPLQLMHYLFEFNTIKSSGKAIFFLESRVFDSKFRAMRVSKACVQAATEAFAVEWPSDFQYMFVCPPDTGVPELGDQVAVKVVSLLSRRNRSCKSKSVLRI